MKETYFLCRLNKDLYRIISPDIATDEVIVTEERLQHIMERHPKDYDLFLKYGVDMIINPDYILEANLPVSAVIFKEVQEGSEKLKLILRLKTSADPATFKNSVITFQAIREKEWRRILRNKKILYKCSDKA